MGRISRTLALVFILIIGISSVGLLAFRLANAQSVTQPSEPVFTAKYIDYVSNIAPTYTINPYTGQNQTVTSGGQEHDRTIQFVINNQPFTPYTDLTGNHIGLYYNFRYKGHFGDTYSYYPFAETNSSNPSTYEQTTHSYGIYGGGPFIYYSASNTETTTITIPLTLLTPFPGGPQIPDGSQVDFEVQSQIGQINPIPSGLLAGDFYNFTGRTSDWINTQTLSISDDSVSASSSSNPTESLSPTPIPTLTVPEFPAIAVLLLLLSVLSVDVIVRHRKAPNLKQ